MQAIFDVYPKWRQAYGYDEDEAEGFMPPIATPNDLMNLVEPTAIHILAPDTDGRVYVGFELECMWDPEHGVGVKLDGDSVIDIGSAPTAFE
jgi:hypothetical protein